MSSNPLFSFSLYGTDPKYTHGMIANVRQIPKHFPAAEIVIYIASDVPSDIYDQLAAFPSVRLISVERKPGTLNMLDRFMAVDEPTSNIVFIRDADSRVHERDAACIEDFMAAPEKQLHIIRDHRAHRSRIMGGIWGIRRSALVALRTSMTQLLSRWSHTPNYMNDQNFLSQIVYPLFARNAMIHDRYGWIEPPDRLTPFRVPIKDGLFVGQVHQFRPDGSEYAVCEP